MVRHRVRHAHRLIRHIHIRTKVQHRRTIAMRPRRTLVHSWHVRSHRTVCRIRVAHVPLGLVRIATITMRQIQRAHRPTAQSRLPVRRVRQIIMELRRVLRVIRHIRIRTKEQHHRITAMHPRRIQGRSWHARSQRTVRRTPVVRVPLGHVRGATIRMQQIRHVRRLIVQSRLPVQRVRQIIMELHRVQRVHQIHPVRRDLMHVQTARVMQGMVAMQQQVHVQSVQQVRINPVRVMHRVGHVLRGITAPVVRIELRAQARQRMRRIPLGQNTIRHRSIVHQ